MSEKQVTAEDARSALRATRLTDRHITMRRGDAVAFFHTIIEQAEQIQRLQKALSLNVVRSGPNPMTRFEYMYERDELRPEDMEPADE